MGSTAAGTLGTWAYAQEAAAAKRSGGGSTGLPDPTQIVVADPADLDAVECVSLLRARRLSSRELLDACLKRISKRNGPLNAWVHIYTAPAHAQARASDRALARKAHQSLPLLVGLPVGLKDLYAVAGRPLTASSRVLARNIAPADSTAWNRLHAAGAVLVGHTQTHEFASGNYTPQCSNPWDTSRTPGGSSAGSAISLAARMIPAATGADTLGSLRIPASICGVSAIKPTPGLVSTYGLIPFAWTFDHAGPMGRSAADVSLLLSYMAGRDPADPATFAYGPRPRLFPLAARRGPRPLAGLRIGVPNQFFGGLQPQPGIAEVFDRFRSELTSLGAKPVSFIAPTSPIDNFDSDSGFQFFLQTVGAEVDLYHRQWYPQKAAKYQPYTAAILAAFRAAHPQASDYLTGQRERTALTEAWLETFAHNRLDLVIQPSALIETPTKLDAPLQTRAIGNPMFVWNFTGFPAASIPAGLSKSTGLPVGAQLVATPENDQRLLQVAIDYQAHFPYHKLAPPAYRT